jgi:carboxylesterase
MSTPARGTLKVLWELEGPEINPLCAMTLLEPPTPSQRCLILFHGITNCPQQLRQLGRMFMLQGWNVLIPRAPHHGLRNRLTTAQSLLRADQLLDFADRMVEVGLGLAPEVTVAGISMGGVLAGWIGQRRPEVARAVLISPLFALHGLPYFVHPPLAAGLRTLPDRYRWWDRKQMLSIKPDHGYPRISTHAYAALLGAGGAVRREARRRAPAATSLIVVTNANDPAVNNRATDQLVRDWRRHGADVMTHEFPRSDRLAHDLIDPSQPDQRIDLVYPVLLDLIHRP